MQELKVKDGNYIPVPMNEYPQDPFQRLVHVEVEDSSKGKYQFDQTYPYIDNSLQYKINRALNYCLRWLFYLDLHCRMGLKIEGKENLKKHKKELEGGAISIANHIYFSEAIGVQMTLRPDGKYYTPMYAKHFNGRNGWLLKYMGGIPVAETIAGSRKFSQAIETFLGQGYWIHIFPEEVRWDFHAAIRPFRKGAFSTAYKYNLPIIPCVYSFRKRTGLACLLGSRKMPLLTLHIGEPVMPDTTAPRKQEVDRLRTVCHSVMEQMAGIESNPWPVIPEDE